MTGFSGVKKYQDYCRKDVMQKGYILLSPVTRHKAYIYDFDELKRIQDKFSEDGFWQYYNEMKKSHVYFVLTIEFKEQVLYALN